MNENKAHGHTDWEMPGKDVSYKIYTSFKEGKLKDLFASVEYIWLAKPDTREALTQRFWNGDISKESRNLAYHVCAVRRLDVY
jgi:hypothetical protein